MGWKEINKSRYTEQLKNNFHIEDDGDLLEKDLLLTLILAEFEKMDLGKELIFKGGTLLSRNYLNYHRFSEDLDFIYKESNLIRNLTRSARERKVKAFLNIFVPELKKVADALGLDFSTDRSNKKYCRMLSGRTVYTFKIYYSENKFIKIEINFIEKMLGVPEKVSIKAITDFFDSRELLFSLGLSYHNFNVLSYPIEEIKLEKYRAILTRNKLKERDLFDLFLIKDSLKINLDDVVEKIRNSSLIKKDLPKLINEKLALLQKDKFFESDEKIEQMAIQLYDKLEFEEFKNKIKPILIEICKKFMLSE